MRTTSLILHEGLWERSRLRWLASSAEQSRALELAFLVACGFLAALASGYLAFRLCMPGHAILRAVFPMALGLAAVPRRVRGPSWVSGAGERMRNANAVCARRIGAGGLDERDLDRTAVGLVVVARAERMAFVRRFRPGRAGGERGGLRDSRRSEADGPGTCRSPAAFRLAAPGQLQLCRLRGARRIGKRGDLVSGDAKEKGVRLSPGAAGVIYVGIDDTDVVGSPGTNQLARLLVAAVAGDCRCRRIVRHQLLDDPRVPYTSKNGSASITLEPVGDTAVADLASRL